MELASKYNPLEVEDKWYSYWLENKYFAAKPNPKKEAYSIVIPPPNVTGVLHMGHMLNNTIQDVLIRRKRMQGFEACWVPGTDHASIATEAKVVKMLEEQGIKKSDLSREEFMKHAWEWKEKYGGIILDQLKKLGASCDWDRTSFTMDDHLSESVVKVFIDYYEKGYVYKGYRMGNWDPKGQTALADDEVIHREVNARLYYVKYQIAGTDEFLTIATTRPETILADTAICVNPEDERYKHLIGKKAIVPLVDREITIIADEYVDLEFGTGCLKVTPAHDVNDYALGQKHGLEIIDMFNADGTVKESMGFFPNEDRKIVRNKIMKLLDEMGQVEKIEEIKHNVGFSERTDAVVEPRLSDQWYVKMDELCKPALENVMNNNIKFHPEKFKNTYRHWMENVRDWCISRQLWWGHRIPAYYLPNGEFVVAENAEKALEKAQEIDANLTAKDLKQEEDVLDTWFSSALWPISVFNGINEPDNEDINYFYPTNDLVTAPEILFFWVARMIISGYEYRDQLPFENVYLTGIVRDQKRRKMSKSLGNSPDPIDLMKIYGADGVRTGMLFCSPAGNDLLFDEKLCEQGRNFSNKIWNAFRLVKGWEIDESLSGDANKVAIDWFESKFNEVFEGIESNYEKYRLSDSLMGIYKLFWTDFASWYLEMVKPAYEQPIDRATYEATVTFLEKMLKVLHPFMPFISEEIWGIMEERTPEERLIVAEYPTLGSFDRGLLEEADLAFGAIAEVRNIRNIKQISPKVAFELYIKTADKAVYEKFDAIIKKLANVTEIHFTDDAIEGAVSFVNKSAEFFVPLEEEINVEEEKEKLTKQLDYEKGFLKSVTKKLSNERFVNNAPEAVITNERNKQADAESKIKALEEQLASLG